MMTQFTEAIVYDVIRYVSIHTLDMYFISVISLEMYNNYLLEFILHLRHRNH